MRGWLKISAIILLSLYLAGCGGVAREVKQEQMGVPAVSSVRQVSMSHVSNLILVKVEVRDYATLSEFKKKLASLSGVGNIYQKFFSADQISELQVDYKGPVQALVDQIVNIKTTRFATEVVSFNQSEITLNLISMIQK